MGEMLGEHGMWFKRTFFDPATKVPLIMTNPRPFSRSKKVTEIVSLVDLTATLMDLANIPHQDYWSSRMRSEEHTSELQSRGHLVCRLLLENKKSTSTLVYN